LEIYLFVKREPFRKMRAVLATTINVFSETTIRFISNSRVKFDYYRNFSLDYVPITNYFKDYLYT